MYTHDNDIHAQIFTNHTHTAHLVANTIDNCVLSHPSLAVDLSDPNNGPSALKHLTQQSSILGHLEDLELLHTNNTTYIEFGSGRGKLSECIQRALQYKLEEERHQCCKRARLSHNHRVVERGGAINTNTPCTPIEASLTSDVKETGSGPTNSLFLYQSSDVSTDVSPVPVEEDDAVLDTTTTLNNVHFLLVDRSNCRRKVDGSLRTSSLIGVQYHRLLMDIEHLDLTMVDCLLANPDTEHVVAVSKHLCGAATDLTLRCLVSGGFRRGESSQGTTSMPRLSGVLIALCCHHRCTWSQLVGKELFTDMGFSPVDFHMISHMTSWAVCGVRPEKLALRTDHMISSETVSDKQSIDRLQTKNSDSDRNDLNGAVESNSVVSAEPHSKCGYIAHSNESIGLKCKRLIDLARIYYLRSHGFKVRVVYYVDKRTSLENVLLIAT